ncbi:MAG: class I SAM-dependent methyltransferase [Patescibacteria group bacterium]
MIIDILYLFFIILFFSAAYASWRAAPWVPTKKNDVDRFLKLLEIKQDIKFYDLGCGDGRLIIAMASKGAKATGLEISVFNYFLTNVKIFFCKSRAVVKFKDFWNVNLNDADLIYVFLMQSVYPKLKKKFEKELKKGAKIAIYAWPMEGWKPVAIDRKQGSLPIYLYQI